MMSRQEAMQRYGDTPMLFHSYDRGKFIYQGTACDRASVMATCEDIEYLEVRFPERLVVLDPKYMYIRRYGRDLYQDEPDPPRYQP